MIHHNLVFFFALNFKRFRQKSLCGFQFLFGIQMNGYCSKTVTKKKTSLLRMQRPSVSNNNIVPKHFTRSIRFNSYKWYSQLTALRCITLWQTLSLLHTPQLFLFPTRAPVWTTIFRDYNLNNLVLPALRQFSPASLNREKDLWSQRTFWSWKFIVTVLRNYFIVSDFHDQEKDWCLKLGSWKGIGVKDEMDQY